MEYRSLGRTGASISPLGLGTWNFGDSTPEAESIAMIHRAVEAGINLIDTADAYGLGESERIVGKALSGSLRDSVVLATKFHFPMGDGPDDSGNSRRHVMKAAEASLVRLGTDRIDLYQAHRPDFAVPQEETLRALDDLVRQGKILHVGSSTFPAWFLMEALATSERLGLCRFESEQSPYNLLDRRIENELVPLALRHGVSIFAWSPLAAGQLAGRYADAAKPPADSKAARVGYVAARLTERGIAVSRSLAVIAKDRGLTPSQLALLWVKDQPGVAAPILGSRTMAQLEDALPVLGMSLDAGTAAALDELVPPGSAVADFHNTAGWMKMKLI
ncbi:MAG: aldo/keto reductase [Spirochaetes bacterium]|nr:aldo/keto reductase [Spirochaetota bacterium]